MTAMEESAIVCVTQGLIRGKKVTTRAGNTYYSFQGIPYAKAPVGQLRFKAPQPADKWDGVRDAVSDGAEAPQLDFLKNNIYIGDEDCLFLNVYTPKVANVEVPRPVMVWIPGGCFTFGTGNRDTNGPDRLMAGDIVLVTMNYRLGVLGFLSTGDSVVPGNNGLKDQVMALRWVQQNIAQFGGDPGNVTIFGINAGGASVTYHLLSPLSKGLFHRAIAQSGSALNPWAFDDHRTARCKAFRLGEALGCRTDCSKKLLDFLMKVTARRLVESVDDTTTEEEKHPLTIFFKPTNEIDNNEKEQVFLPKLPNELMAQGKFNSVPFMTGITSMEAMFVLKDFSEHPLYYQTLNNKLQLNVILPKLMNAESCKNRKEELATKIKEFYFGDKNISKETSLELCQLYSDGLFVSGVYTTARKLQSRNNSVYLYQFSFEGSLGFHKVFFKEKPIPGTIHGDEFLYLFDNCLFGDINLNPNDDEMKMSSKMIQLWTDFARTGNPTPKWSLASGLIWRPFTKSDLTYLDINKDLTMKKKSSETSYGLLG